MWWLLGDSVNFNALQSQDLALISVRQWADNLLDCLAAYHFMRSWLCVFLLGLFGSCIALLMCCGGPLDGILFLLLGLFGPKDLICRRGICVRVDSCHRSWLRGNATSY